MTPRKKTKSEVLSIIQGEPDLDIRKKMIIQCLDKERHETRNTARKHMRRHESMYNVKARFYDCRICGCFHVTTKFK
jgi:hypothetical protein